MIAGAFWYWFVEGGSGGIPGDVVGGFIQLFIMAAIASAVWPPLRRVIGRFLKEHVHLANAELHAKLDHIIEHHPDIPPFGLLPRERITGLRGIRRHEPVNPRYEASRPAALTAPATYSATRGRTLFPSFGNLTWDNCFWAMLANMTELQALVSMSKGTPVFVPGFVPLLDDIGITWYKGYCIANGQSPTPNSGGTGIYSGAAYIESAKLALFVAVLGPTGPNGTYEPDVIREAIYDFDGGAGFCLALDSDYAREFENRIPWGTDSSVPDDENGHAVAGAKYDPDTAPASVGLTFISWEDLVESLNSFDTACIDGVVLVITQGFITKFGEARAQALAAKWGMTVIGQAA